MEWLDLTLPRPAENLALDELLLDRCEADASGPVLRFWEAPTPFVVLGYGKDPAREVELGFCRERSIPVYRRCSGGGTVLQAPGVLSYALVLPIAETGPVRASNAYVMERQRRAMEAVLGEPVSVEGFTDLCVGGLKFSGNAQRRKRRFLLFHGTFLLDADIDLIERTLKMPAEKPAYRRDRPHRGFLKNLRIDPERIKASLKDVWQAGKKASAAVDLGDRASSYEDHAKA